MSSESYETLAHKLFQTKHESTASFDSHQAEVDERAKDWAHYHGRDYDRDMWTLLLQHQVMAGELAENAWDMEKRLFPTDDLQKQQTRFIEMYREATIEEAKDKSQGS
ncbi:MAG: hypothetical protein NVS4B11_07640 [Ktedonobacteraceae bacterium]